MGPLREPFLLRNCRDYARSKVPHSEELFYQLGLRQFNNFAKFRLEPAPPLRKLISIAVDAEDGISRAKLTKEQATEVSGRFHTPTVD